MAKPKKPNVKVINIMKSGRIVEDMSTVTIPPDIYKNVMRILYTHCPCIRKKMSEAEGSVPLERKCE